MTPLANANTGTGYQGRISTADPSASRGTASALVLPAVDRRVRAVDRAPGRGVERKRAGRAAAPGPTRAALALGRRAANRRRAGAHRAAAWLQRRCPDRTQPLPGTAR